MLLKVVKIPSHPYILADDTIDIWQFPLNKLPGKAITLLNEQELIRANRFYFERHRRRFIVARAMLRRIIGIYLKKDANELVFDYNQYGKPQINLQYESVEFNLSHSADLALLAIGKGFPLGIDLEFFSARPYDGIARSLFSQAEIAFFSCLPNFLKTHAFFHIWAQKEAFIKACGMGLAYPTQQFDVVGLAKEVYPINDKLHNGKWLMLPFTPQAACSGALCFNPKINKINYLVLPSLDVLLPSL